MSDAASSSRRLAVQYASARGSVALCVLRRLGVSAPLAHVRLLPELASYLDWIDADAFPPCLLVSSPMGCAVVGAAERDCELIADLAAERARLREAQVMRVGWLARAEQAWQRGDVAQVLLVAVAPRDADGEHALVDGADLMRMRVGVIDALARARLLGCGGRRRGSPSVDRWRCDLRGREPGDLLLECILQQFGIGSCEAVLGGKDGAGPACRGLRRSEARNLAEQPFAQGCRFINWKDRRHGAPGGSAHLAVSRA